MKHTRALLPALCIAHCALCTTTASAAVGDATVAKWADDARGAFMLMFDDGWPSLWQAAMPALEARNLPADFYIIPEKGEFKVFENVWKEKFKNPLFRFGNHTWTHGGFDDYEGAVQEFGKCTDYLRANVPGKPDRLISYAQPGVPGGRWNINREQEEQICRDQGLVARPPFHDHGATYHLKNKDELLSKAKKAAAEGIAEYVIFHGVEVDDPKRGYQDFWAVPVKEYIPFFDEVAAMRDRGEIWVADHISVHQYETERATAKVRATKDGTKGIRLAVTCDADPKLYDYPLTLKVEVPPAWKAAKFRQGKDGEVATVRVENGVALVKAVPNGTPVDVVESKDVPAPPPQRSNSQTPQRSNDPTIQRSNVHWTWSGWGGGGWFWSSAADPKDPNVFYMGGDVDGLWKTTDGGRSWAFANAGLQNYGVYSLAVAPSDGRFVYALTQDGVAASADGAKTWTPCAETRNGALKVSASRGGSVKAVAVDPRDPRTVYAGGANGRAVKSTDGGRTWTVLDYLSSRTPEAGEIAEPVSGSGYGRLTVAANANDWSNYVRIQKFLSQDGEDWSACDTVGVKVFLPKDAPAGLAATIVLQSGAWTWKEGPMKTLAPGAWTTVEYPLSTYADPKKVQMVHFVIRTNGNGFKGDVGLDAFVATGAGKRVVLGEWDGPGADGWGVSPDNNTKSVTKAIVSSRQPSVPAAGDPIGCFAVSGADPRLVFLSQRKFGLFRSTDGGATWTHLKDAPKGASVVCWAGPRAPRTWYGAFGRSGAFLSTDDGLTWRSLGMPLEGDQGARDVIVNPKDPKTAHVLVSQGFGGYVATTRDGGATWTATRDMKADHVYNPTLPGNGDRANMSGPENLSLSPADPERIHMAGNWNPAMTHDGARTWFESARGADITCFHDIRHLGGVTYGAAMDEGTCATADGGATWKALFPLKWQAGMSGHHWRVLPQKLADGRTRVISTVSPWAHGHDFPVKVIVSEDGGKTFEEAKGLPDYRTHANTMWGEGHGRAIAADPTNPDLIYLGIDGDPEGGNAGGGVFKSVDGGHNWTQLPAQPGSRRMMYGLAVDPTNPKRLVWGACGETAGVYVSEDAGGSWTKAAGLNDWIFNVDVTPKGTIYAGGSQLWRSDDHGKSFRAVTSLKGVTVVGIAVDPADENRVWISGTTWNGNREGGIYESLDGGKTWTEITGDIAYTKPLVLRYDPATRQLWAAGPAAFRTKR